MKTLRSTKQSLFPLAVQLGIGCCALMLSASASATSFYSGANCVAVNGTAAYEDGVILNVSITRGLRLYCPVNTDGIRGLEKGGVRFRDHNVRSDVHCTLTSRSSAGPDSSAPRITTSGSGGGQSRESAGVSYSGAGYRTYFDCYIPERAPTEASSGIEAYYALEPL